MMTDEPIMDDTARQAPEPEVGSSRISDADLRLIESLIVDRLGTLARSDPQLARACSVLGQLLIEVGTGQRQPAREAAREAGQDAQSSSTDLPKTADEPAQQVPTVERTLSLAGASIALDVPDDGSAGDGLDDGRAGEIVEVRPISGPRVVAEPVQHAITPELVIRRARLLAECCRWAIQRRQRLADDADFEQSIKPRDKELVEQARGLPDCYAWPLDPYNTLPDDRTLETAGGCYEALADGLELAVRVRGDDELFESYGLEAYELLAACCSSLRVVLEQCDIYKDTDQLGAFGWLKRRTDEDRIFVQRHMRLTDPADPEAWPDRCEAIATLAERIDTQRAHTKERTNLLGKIGYIAKRWDDFDSDERAVQTEKLAGAIERLVELGVQPSNGQIRDPLLTIADDLPDAFEPTGAMALALRYADEHAARLEAESRREPASTAEPTAEVVKARALLGGKVAVLIGGDCRPRSRDALRDGLGLKELRWVATRPHESIDNFEAQVRRDDVAVVLLAIRWASHSFEGIKKVCDRAGKPFVRLPRGYGVNRVAHEIVSQVSEALDSGCTKEAS